MSAVALLLLGGWFLYALFRIDPLSHAELLDWVARPFNTVMLLLLSVTLAWHSAIGVQVVLEDYVHGAFLKVACLVANRFAHVFLGIAAVVSILMIALGATS